ncbi:MAG: hypothetical protein ACRD04_04495 [Terriglobales bacterium]
MRLTARTWFIVLALAAGLPVAALAGPLQLISNGSFSNGFSSWTVTNEPGGGCGTTVVSDGSGSCGSWFVVAGSTAAAALSGLPLPGPSPDNAANYALADENDPAASALTQSFTMPDGSADLDLTFDMFVNSWPDETSCGSLDFPSSSSVQCAYVSILAGGANALSAPGSTGVVDSLFMDAPLGPSSGSNPWVSYEYSLTNLTPGDTYQLQFAQADNQGLLNVGVTDVSLTAVTATPEPASIWMLGTGLLLLGLAWGFGRSKARRAGAQVC